jgi:hypothetical protein
MSKTQTWRVKTHVWDAASKTHVPLLVDLEVDLDSLAWQMGKKARKNARRRSGALNGAIIATIKEVRH